MSLDKDNSALTGQQLADHLLEHPGTDLRPFLDGSIRANKLLIAADKVAPDDSQLASRLFAHAGFIQRKYEYACNAFQSAAVLTSRGVLPLFDTLIHAKACRANGDFHNALILLDTALQSDPDSVELQLERAINLLFTNNSTDALKAANEAATGNGKEGYNVPPRALEWLITYLQTMHGQPVTGDAWSRRALTRRYKSRSDAESADVLFGVFDYKTPDFIKSSMNIGDNVQTVALMRHLARRDLPNLTFDDPDLAEPFQQLSKTWDFNDRRSGKKSAHILVMDRDAPWSATHGVGSKTIRTIVYGWFFHQPFNSGSPFPLPDNVRPIILSFYLQRPEDLTPAAVTYLSEHQPIGCRDWSTCYWLLNQGIDAFFSGCVTQTLNVGDPTASEGVYCVDTDDAHTDPQASYIGQNEPRYRAMSFGEATTESLRLLELYNNAEKITTSRLHCYLPSVAMGKSVNFHPKIDSDRRFDGLDNMNGAEATRGRITKLLDLVLSPIFDGASHSDVQKVWRQATSGLVQQARQKLHTSPWLFGKLVTKERNISACKQADRQANVVVALAFDRALYEKVFVVINSILSNTRSTIEFVFLTRGIEKADQNRLEDEFSQAEFRFILMDGNLEGVDIKLAPDTTISTMDRLYLPELLPEYDRVVYIDVDTIVLGDIKDLAEFTPSERGIAACPTPNPHHNIQAHWIERAITRHGYDVDTAREYRRMTAAQVDLLAPYFNAGVLVLSLTRLRELDFTHCALQTVERYDLEDQEVLNLFSLGNYTRLPDEWNAQPYSHWFDKAKLIHWPGAAKPWIKHRKVRFADYWKKYADRVSGGEAVAAEEIVPTKLPCAVASNSPPDECPSSEMWKNPESYEPGWNKRAQMVVPWLSTSGRIADVGCGAPLSLKEMLAPAVEYVPADIVSWTPDVVQTDLDKKEFPPGEFSTVVMLGVLEYLEKPGLAMRMAHKASSSLVTSYCHPQGVASQALRKQRGWVNAFQEKGLERLLLRSGWKIVARKTYTKNSAMLQVLYHCEKCEPLRPPLLSPVATRVRKERLTYLRPEKMHRLEKSLDRLKRENIPGIYTEFGVALGGSAIVIADHAKKLKQQFVGFDVFEMIPEPQSVNDDEVSRARYNVIKSGASKGIGQDVYYGYRKDLHADVVHAFQRYGLSVNGTDTRLEKGFFELTWPGYSNRKVAFAHIDCDWYDPVKFCLNAMLDSLVPGGIILIDDYHDYAGAKLATDEFLAENPQFVLEAGDNPILVRAS